MMRNTIVIALMLSTAYLGYADSNGPSIKRSQFDFVDRTHGLHINFDTKVEEVVKYLGQPIVGKGKLSWREFKTLQWRGLEFFVLPSSGEIVDIRITTKDLATIDGVVVGDEVGKVRSLYGRPVSEQKDSLEYDYVDPKEAQYADGSEVWGLVFNCANDAVTSIEMGRLD